jgi:hypothetical protein
LHNPNSLLAGLLPLSLVRTPAPDFQSQVKFFIGYGKAVNDAVKSAKAEAEQGKKATGEQRDEAVKRSSELRTVTKARRPSSAGTVLGVFLLPSRTSGLESLRMTLAFWTLLDSGRHYGTLSKIPDGQNAI